METLTGEKNYLSGGGGFKREIKRFTARHFFLINCWSSVVATVVQSPLCLLPKIEIRFQDMMPNKK